MAAAGVLMQSNIKFNGALLLQMYGDGPVKLAVAEVRSDLSFRATATTARFFPDFPPRAASRSPKRLKSQSLPKGPRM
mgnify:CR=1 FL=1